MLASLTRTHVRTRPRRRLLAWLATVEPPQPEVPMSIVVRFAPASLTAAQYDQTIGKLEESGDFPPDGLDVHLCFGSDGNLLVSEVWDSREQFEAFGPRLMPVLQEAGIDPGEPTVLEVHNLIRR